MKKEGGEATSKIEIRFQRNENSSLPVRRVSMDEAIRTAMQYFSVNILPYVVSIAFDDIKLREEGEYVYWDVTLVVSGIAQVKYKITIDAQTGDFIEFSRIV